MKVLLNAVAAILTIMSLTLLSGCREEKTYKIGVSQCSQDDWRHKMNEEINREIMFHENATVEIRSADDDNDRQIADIRYFADNDFDIIIVSPNEAAALTPVIKEVYERGIPVIIFDRNINGPYYTARIGVDDRGLGRSAAHYALHLNGRDAKALEIYGRPGSTPAEDRHEGFVREFNAGGGEVIATVTGNWNRDDAVQATDSVLRNHKEINLIFAHNDRMAISAAETAHRLGRDDIRIIGIDAAPSIGIRAVADSVLDATFLYPTEGHRLIRTALAILNDRPYEKETILPVSSAVDLTNADILLLQNNTLVEETDKIKILKHRIDDYWARHSSQTYLFYASIAIILLLLGVVFLVLRLYWQHKNHQQELLNRNRELEEQSRLQRSLNEQLQAATQSKLMFFTNVSHDLRTPLTLIAEPVNRLANASNLTPQQHNLIKIADKNVRILRRLINQILDFRKYENNRLELRAVETDLAKAIGEWMESFHSLARKQHIDLCLVHPAEGSFPASMAVDPEKMERVFFNLLSNAFKFTPPNGKITVSYSSSADEVTISVADTGEGIPESDLESIFNRFYRVERVHPDGSGIGLSVCKAFVELHGGTITVESRLKKGSAFTVTLPVRHVAGQAAEVEKSITGEDVDAELDTIDSVAELDNDRPLLLVIDDNRDIQRLLKELLGTDYNVITASNGAEGIRKAVKYVPDLIICDVMMPVMDGLECCRRLKEEVTTSHIPVLMLTACSMDEQRVQGYTSGADGYLSKPFSGDVLLARCASLIDNRKRIKELWQKSGFNMPGVPAASAAHESAAGGAAGLSKVAAGHKPRPADDDIDSDFYRRFLEIFTAEMGNSGLSVDTIASRMGLERTQFYRKIKALTNFSPVELIRKLRLEHGRRLLTSSDKSVSEIAYEAGFSTPAYFTRCYREAYGETPTETRAGLYKE